MPVTTTTQEITPKDIATMEQVIRDYETREHWRTMKQWAEQCYAPDRVATIEVQSHEEWDKTDHYTCITAVLAYDAQGEIVPYDLSRPFFQDPAVLYATSGTLLFLKDGEVPSQEQLYEDIYCAGCLCKDWVCTCSLPTEARTYDIAAGEPPFPWSVQIERTDGLSGEDLHPF